MTRPINFTDYQDLFDIKDITGIEWRTNERVHALSIDLFNSSTPQIDSISLKEKLKPLRAIVKRYKPSFCRVIWEIITLSLTFFNVWRVKCAIRMLDQRIKATLPDSEDVTEVLDDEELQIIEDKTVGIVGLDNQTKKRLFKRNSQILNESLKLIEKDEKLAGSLDDSIVKVKAIFQDKLKKLKRGKYTPVTPSWCHATVNLDYVESIVKDSALHPGHRDAWGRGVYFSSSPENIEYYEANQDLFPDFEKVGPKGAVNGYGAYIFSIDALALEHKSGSDVPTNGTFILPDWAKTRAWLVAGNPSNTSNAPDYIRVNAQTAMIAVPDGEEKSAQTRIESVWKSMRKGVSQTAKKVEVVGYRTFKAMRYYLQMAEEQLNLVDLPEHITRYSSALKIAQMLGESDCPKRFLACFKALK